MPIHDWTRVDHGSFHDFHQGWATAIRSALNNGLLPPDYEAKVEQHKPLTATESASDSYARLRDIVVLRQDERLATAVELVAPGNKSNNNGIREFARKMTAAIDHGIHVLVLDLFPRDPSGIHPVIWSEYRDELYSPPPDKPLTFVSYAAGPTSRAYIQPAAVGEPLPEMPLFLEPESYISLPLEATYASAFAGIPRRTRVRLGVPQ